MTFLPSYFNSEFLASGLSNEFYDFITQITHAKNKEEEGHHVTHELSHLSSIMGSPDISSSKMRDYLIRLMHCYMLGYDIDFSVIYAIMATQSGENEYDRRVGYLACILFLRKDHEMTIMLINTLQRDLKSQNDLDQCAALNAICYIEHPDLSDNVIDLVLKAAEFPKQIVRKKAIAALYHLHHQSNVPFERIESTLRRALEDKDSSVVFSALSIWRLVLNETNATQYEDLLPVFSSVLRQILEKKIHKSFAYHGVLAPWAQMDCLCILTIYQKASIGSPKEVYHLTMDCLNSAEKKVDAAYAIVLECIQLLSSIDSLLVSSLSDESPFHIIDSYLTASNHNLKYLGLKSMSMIDHTFWKKRWLDGSLLGAALETSYNDDTLISLILVILDTILDRDILFNLSSNVLTTLFKCHDLKDTCHLIGSWYINKLDTHYVDHDSWFIETTMTLLFGNYIKEDMMASQCRLLKSLIAEEMLGEESDNHALREKAVDTAFTLLKKCHSNHHSPSLLQLIFWILGEYGHLSDKQSQIDIMGEIQRLVVLLDDDYLQIHGLQAIKKCILRKKVWLSGLKGILREYKKSALPEKQLISREILLMLNDEVFRRELQEGDTTQSMLSLQMSAPHSPTENSILNDYSSLPVIPDGHPRKTPQNKWKGKERVPNTHYTNQSQTESPLMSSLIALELDEQEIVIDKKMFGQLWRDYQLEKKLRFGCPVNECGLLSQKLKQHWKIEVVEVVDHEFIGYEPTHHSLPSVLIHVIMLPNNQFELTVRAKQSTRDIKEFLSRRRLT